MKMVRCVINPARLEAIKKTLWSAGYQSITVTEAQGLGAEKSAMSGQGADHVVDFSPRVCLEMAVADSAVDAVIELVVDSVRTGRVGDGKIFVSSLDQVVRVRTGERGDTAL
jgi:nitrogen regulatory protein PII